jgi:hypothetical protein
MPIDEGTLELIVDLVVDALRGQLEDIVAGLSVDAGDANSERHLTVEEVAERFHVARSTVYAHWREWGGYKLGEAGTAPIRFDAAGLPAPRPGGGPTPRSPISLRTPNRTGRKRRSRRNLVVDTPRFDRPLEELG